jgi:hypothetical protein
MRRSSGVIGLLLVAGIIAAAGGLRAQAKERIYFGLRGGYSFLAGTTVEEGLFPGRYPNRPAVGLFLMTTNTQRGSVLRPQEVCLEIDYLDQSAVYDVVIRDDLGNIIAIYPETCSRKYLEILDYAKWPLKRRGRVTPVLEFGAAMTVLLKTSRDPGAADPVQASFKGAVFSFILGAGLEFRVGKRLLLLDLRYDWGFDSLDFGRDDPRPDSLQLLAGIAF